jgi:hypothetical protein
MEVYKGVEIKLAHLPVGGAVVLDDPPRLAAERLEHLVVVAVLGQLVVAERAEAREDLGGDGPPPALPALVVLPLLPRRRPPQTSRRRRRRRRRPGRHGLMLSQPLLPEAPTCLPFSLMERWWVAYCTVLTTTTSGGGREATERREVAAWWRCSSSSRVGVECCYVMAWRASCFERFHSRARPGSRSRGWYRKLITLLQLNWLDSTGTAMVGVRGLLLPHLPAAWGLSARLGSAFGVSTRRECAAARERGECSWVGPVAG